MDATVDEDAIFVAALVLSLALFIRVQGLMCTNFHRGLKLGFQGLREGPSGGELVVRSIVVFDRAAVIAPQRLGRVSIIKTRTSERVSLPQG